MVILVDTGPLVALFDPQDNHHQRCRDVLASLTEALITTVPVLTEAFHTLSPGSQGTSRLRDFTIQGGLSVWFMHQLGLVRAFE